MGMTKEERKAKKEAKRLEKLAQEELARKILKRAELKRELKAQSRRRAEIDQSFRELMMKVKEPVFRQDIEVMWHTFERALDKKDHNMQFLMKLMDIADDQFQRTVSSFCENVDSMINKFLAELEVMSQDNNKRTAAMLKLGEDEADLITKDHNTAETHLQLLLYHSHHAADTQAWAMRGEYLVKEDEERMKYANERENLGSELENNYNNVWDEYKAVLKAYVTGTAENQKNVRKLRRKDNAMADIIASQGKRIANNDGLLRRLRTELAAYESGTKQAVFRDRRDRHRVACFALKKNMIDGVKLDAKYLAILVKASDVALEWLESSHKKGEKILRMASLCRKFETQREKVLPYGTAQPLSPPQSKTNIRKSQSDDSLVMNAIQTTCGLTRLWQRVAKAELTKRALYREKQLLLRENSLIVDKIQAIRDRPAGGPTASACPCNEKNYAEFKASQTVKVTKPVAVDGTLEVSKRSFI